MAIRWRGGTRCDGGTSRERQHHGSTILRTGRHRHRFDRRSEHRPVVCTAPRTGGRVGRRQRPRRGSGGVDRGRVPGGGPHVVGVVGSMDRELAVPSPHRPGRRGIRPHRSDRQYRRWCSPPALVRRHQRGATARDVPPQHLAHRRPDPCRSGPRPRRQRRLRRDHFERLTAQDHLGHGLLRLGQGRPERHDAHDRGRPGRQGCAGERRQSRAGAHHGDPAHLEEPTPVRPPDPHSPSDGSPRPRTSPPRCASCCPTTHGRSPGSRSMSTAGTTSRAVGRRSGS